MDDKKRVMALGFFDGIHIGHAALIQKAKEMAKRQGTVPSVLTFDQHPDTFVKGVPVPLINSPFDRKDIIGRLFGVHEVIFIHFDERVMRMNWEAFLERVVSDFNVTGFVAGHDFTFGYKGEGNVECLMKKSRVLGIECEIVPKVEVEGITVSSTYIRELISAGDVERANLFLWDTLMFSRILSATGISSAPRWAFRQSTCAYRSVIVPPYGVYATKVHLQGEKECALPSPI